MLELFLRFIAAPAIEIQDEEFSLADVTHGGVTEPREGVLNGLSLGIKYGAFWHYPDVCFHAVSITLPQTGSCFAPFAGWYKGVDAVRQGKFFELELEGGLDKAAASAEVERIAKEVLTNPVIEEFSYRLEP